MRNHTTLGASILLSALILALCAVASADTIFYTRGLPDTTNTNLGTANRSNVDWGNVNGWMNGDSIVVPASPLGAWRVNTISVWEVGPADGFANFKLYGGPEGSPGAFGLISSSASVARQYYTPDVGIVGGVCSAPGSGENYLGSGGGCYAIYKVTFSVTGLILSPGTVYDFGADATPLGTCNTNSPGGCLYLHATNAALRGSTVWTGFDNQYLLFDTTDLTGGHYVYNSAPLAPCPVNYCGGWDKSSDINVEFTGDEVVPEPATFGMMLVGAAPLLWFLRRRM